MADLLSLAIFKNIAGKSKVSKKSSANSVQKVSGLDSRQENILVDLMSKKQNLSSYISSASKTSLSQTTSTSVESCGKKVTLSEIIKPNNTSSNAKPVSASDVLANMSKPMGKTSPQLGQKVDIKSLANGVKTPKAASASYDAKKNTTVTLNELANKCKKGSSAAPVETTVKVETGVKKSVIGNALGIGSLIPKISLNSIGKSNSFFK